MIRWGSNRRISPPEALGFRFLSVALILTSCGGDGDVATKRNVPPPTVRVALAERTTLAERLELTGSIEPTRAARMASPVEGPVVACPVREGDAVGAGDTLVLLGRMQGDDAVAASARAELEREELDAERIAELVESGALPGEDLDAARVRVSAAQARLARATETLGDYRITAPWEGVVSRLHVAEGDFVAPRTLLVVLFDPANLVLRFAVPESRAALLCEGAALEVTFDAHPGERYCGRIARVYPEIDRDTHARTAEAEIDAGPLLIPGMFARVELLLSERIDVVAVPQEALLEREGDMATVFVVTTEGRAERRRLKTDVEDGGRVEIVEGLREGERVAVAGHGRLRDGVAVRVVNEGPAKKAGAAAGVPPAEGAPLAGGNR